MLGSARHPLTFVLLLVSRGVAIAFTEQQPERPPAPQSLSPKEQPTVSFSRAEPPPKRQNPRLRKEMCPGPPELWSGGLKWIVQRQNSCTSGDTPRPFLVPGETEYFFGGSSGKAWGLGAQLGPATALLGQALTTGRIYTRVPLSPARDVDSSQRFAPMTNCPTPQREQVQQANWQQRWWDYGNDRLAEVGMNHSSYPILVMQRFWHARFWNAQDFPRLDFYPWGNDMLPGFRLETPVWQALAAKFFLRLSDETRTFVEDALDQSLPDGFQVQNAVFMHVRSTADKCGGTLPNGDTLHGARWVKGEMQCLRFDEYMELADQIRQFDPAVREVIVTSDSSTVIDQARAFAQKNASWRFTFNAANENPNAAYEERHSSLLADRLSLASLHLAFRARYLILNGNSMWDRLIGQLVEHGGCSLAHAPQTIFLDRQRRGKFLSCGIMNQDPRSASYIAECDNWQPRPIVSSAPVPATGAPAASAPLDENGIPVPVSPVVRVPGSVPVPGVPVGAPDGPTTIQMRNTREDIQHLVNQIMT